MKASNLLNPNNRVKTLPKKFESKLWASEKSLELQGKLLKSNDPDCIYLAKVLQNCKQRRPCKSAACPKCMRTERAWFISQIRSLANKEEWRFVTSVFYPDAMTTDQLETFSFIKLRDRLRKQLEACGIDSPAIGGFEVDYHSESGLWIPHAHFIVKCKSKWKLDIFRNFYKKDKYLTTRPGVKNRPILVKKIRHLRNLSGYLFKSDWCRVEHWESLGKRRSKKLTLRQEELEVALRVRDEIGVAGLRFFYRVRKVQNGLKIKIQ